MISNIEPQTSKPIDPDVYDWLDAERLEDLFKKFDLIYDLLYPAGLLRQALIAWTRQQLLLQLNASADLLVDPKASEMLLMSWAEELWSHRLETLYLEQKNELDFVTCSLIRVKNQFLAFELFQRLKSDEASFEELSWQFGQGEERKYGGRFLKKRMQAIPPAFHSLIKKMRPGEVLKPHRLGDWFVVMSLEEHIPSQFDKETQRLLLKCELNSWISSVVSHLESVLNSEHSESS